MRAFFALLLALLIGPAAAQVTPGNQPLSIAKGGTSAGTRTGAFSALAPAPTRAGDISYWNGSAWVTVPGNNSGTQILTENASGVPGWSTPGGTGTVTSLTPGDQITMTPNPITSSGTVRLTAGAANTIKGSVNGTTTSDLAISSCSALYNFTQWISGTGWQCGINPVLPSRAVAATLNLSAFTSVTTQGYTTAGDGGGATFVKVGAVPLKDSYILTATVAGGSGYTNGTYLGVRLGGGTGLGCQGTATVAGGAVTAISTRAPCSGFAVGDVLTPLQSDVGGTGSGATWTVATVSTAMGSFADSASNKFQYVVDSGGIPNVRQFGAKQDWNGVDGSATNDILAYRSSIAFLYFPFSSSAALINGGTLLVPKGASLLCDGTNPFASLVIPQGIRIRGASLYGGATLKQCTSENSSSHFISLCDPVSKTGQFGCKLEDIALIADGTSQPSIAAIYTFSGQQFPLIENVYISPGNRGCIYFDLGQGGASNAIFNHFDCESPNTVTNNGITIAANVGGVQTVFRDFVLGCSGGTCTRNAFAVLGGANFVAENGHIEGTTTGFSMGNTGLSAIRNITGGTGCTSLVTLLVGNPNNKVLVENLSAGSCTTTVTNGHSGGANTIGDILLQKNFNP